MRKIFIYIFFILVFSSCAPTSIVLNNCKNNIYLDAVKIEDVDKIDQRPSQEISTEFFALFYPREVQLNKVILENKLKCTDLEKVEIEVQEKFGLFNKIILRF